MILIPKTAEWCTDCIISEPNYCEYHSDIDGNKIDYWGVNVYIPTDYVLEIVGSKFLTYQYANATDGGPLNTELKIFICTGYDPRNGFWMCLESGGYKICVNESSIGKTYLRI